MMEVLRQIEIPGGGPSTCGVFSRDGQWLAVVRGIEVYIYETSGYQLRETLVLEHAAGVSQVCWSPDGKCIASCSDDFTVVVTHRQLGLLHRLVGHTAPVISLCYNNKG
ncbi:hypothetical protein JR040_35530, partial [Pseudomonas sp. PAH14]|nr:hypothetical protein [Pseudomonas sp. PAH14]